MFSVESVGYNGKIHDHLCKLRPVASGLKESGSLSCGVVVIPFCHQQSDITLQPGEMFMDDFLELGASDPDRQALFLDRPGYGGHQLLMILHVRDVHGD